MFAWIDWQIIPYTLPQAIAALILAAITAYAWRQRSLPGAASLAAITAAVTIWAAGNAFELGLPDLGSKVLAAKIEYLGVVAVCPALFLFVMQYTGRPDWLARRSVILLAILPAFFLAAVWTNELHRQFFSEQALAFINSVAVVRVQEGWLYWANVGYAYLLAFTATLALFEAYKRSSGIYRRQAGLMLAGVILPWIGNILYVSKLSPFGSLDLTPFGFGLAGILLAVSLFRYRILDVRPLARRQIMDAIHEGMVVLDSENRIIEANRLAEQAIGLHADALIGKSAQALLEAWAKNQPPADGEKAVGLLNQGDSRQVVTMGLGEQRRHFDVRLQTLSDAQGRRLGRLVLWRDITQQERAKQHLQTERNLMRTLIDHLPLTIFVRDTEGRFLLINQMAAGKIRKTAQELMGRLTQEVETPERAERFLAEDQLVLSSGQPYVHLDEVDDYLSDERRWELTTKIPLASPGELPGGVIGIIQDVTEVKLTENALRRQIAELSVLHAITRACVEEMDEDRLVARATAIMGEQLFQDNCGLLLVDEAAAALRFHPSYLGVDEAIRRKTIRLDQGITGLVAATGVACRVGDISSEPRYLDLSHSSGSELCVPLKLGGRVIGVINAERRQVDAFSEADERLLVTVAGQLATAIERLRAESAGRRRLAEVTLLGQISQFTASGQDLPSALNRACEEVSHYLGAPQAGFALIDETGKQARVIAEYNREMRTSALGAIIPVQGNPSMELILVQRSALVIENAQTDPRLAPIHDLMRMRSAVTLLIVPVLIDGQVSGTLGFDFYETHCFTPTEVELVQNVANQLGLALERLRLYGEVRIRAERMNLLTSLGETLNRTLTTHETLEAIGKSAMQLVGVDRAAIFECESLLAGQQGLAACIWAVGVSPQYLTQVTSHMRQKPGDRLVQGDTPALISDVERLPEDSPVRLAARSENIRSLALWPLTFEGQITAAIGAYHPTPRDWDAGLVEVMRTFCRQAVVALQNARLFEETRRRALQQEALNGVIAAASTAPDVPGLLETALDLLTSAFGLEHAGIWVHGASALRGRLAEPGCYPEQVFRASVFDLSEALFVDDWERLLQDARLGEGARCVRACNLRATLTVPVQAEGRTIGGMGLADEQTRPWREEEISLAEAVGRQLGSAVERLNLIARIQEQARLVQQIMDNVPEGVLLLDHARRIALANPAAEAMLPVLLPSGDISRPLSRLGAVSLESLFDSSGRWVEICAGAQAAPGSAADDPAATRLQRTFEAAAQSLQRGGVGSGWVLVLREVTDERENQKRIQMQDRLATVGQLAAGIAHDFNNIMAAIVVYTDLLLMDARLPDASRDRLVIIQQQVQRAASLIRQILDFSRRAVMEQSELDLLPFIKELDKLLGRVLPETIRLNLEYQPGAYLVTADPTRLQQVFMNLALNARDAMPAGGVLSFRMGRLRLAHGDPVPVSDLEPGEWIWIEVHDTGEGISPETLPHIFEPFFTTKPVGKGTGLGLAQVYGIIKQHGGSLDVRSRPGEGATFTLYLPALQAATPIPIPEPGGEPAYRGEGEQVLLVEDDEAARQALRALFEAQNYRVETATNGLDALFKYDPARFKLVVSDIVMPEMGGMELYRALRNSHPQVKILFITGHPLDESIRLQLEGGSLYWLQKPFSMLEISRLLRQILES